MAEYSAGGKKTAINLHVIEACSRCTSFPLITYFRQCKSKRDRKALVSSFSHLYPFLQYIFVRPSFAKAPQSSAKVAQRHAKIRKMLAKQNGKLCQHPAISITHLPFNTTSAVYYYFSSRKNHYINDITLLIPNITAIKCLMYVANIENARRDIFLHIFSKWVFIMLFYAFAH